MEPNDSRYSSLSNAEQNGHETVEVINMNSDKGGDGEPLWRLKDEEDRSPVYRKLYAILTIMTMVLFAINIVQVCLLHVIDNLYWIVLFPLVVFAGFLAWAAAVVVANPHHFHISTPQQYSAARRHLRRLFQLRAQPWNREELRWPTRFSRFGILATILLNVILVEFVYLPVFGLPTFKEINWNIQLNVIPPHFPAVAVIQNFNSTQIERAIFPLNNATWQKVCHDNDRPRGSCVDNRVFTFRNISRPASGNTEVQIHYAIYDPPLQKIAHLGIGMDLYYPFSYDSRGGNILTEVAFFDPSVIDYFPSAWQCGILSNVQLGTFESVQIDLSPVSITDKLNAFQRTDICAIEAFQQYTTYTTRISGWGPQFTPDTWNSCDVSGQNGKYQGPCTGHFQFVFTSLDQTYYESKHGTNWINLLTTEGGIVGFVTFLTWFLGIFAV